MMFFSIKVKRGCAVRWPQVGDTAAAMRLGEVGRERRRNEAEKSSNHRCSRI